MRLTIGKKLNALIVTLQLLSIGGVVVLATQLFTADLTGLLRKNTLDVASMLAGRVKAEMKHVADRARMLGAASLEDYKYEEDKLRFLQDNLAVDPQYVGMGLYRKETAAEGTATAPLAYSPVWRIVHPALAKKLSLTSEDFKKLDAAYPILFEQVAKGSVDFNVAKLKDGTPSLRMALPFVQQADGTFSQILVTDLHQERLTAVFAEASTTTSFLIDKRGRVLASTDPLKFALGDDMSALPIVAGLAEAKGQSGQTDFKDKNGELQIGAFQRVGFADLTIISQVPMERAELAQQQLYRRTAFLAGAFLFLALFLGVMFSQAVSTPIKALASAAELVAKGDFTIRLKTKARKNPANGDEIEQVSRTFNEMVTGLEERDRVKATFAKFHSKEMAEKVLSGELKLGGERKSAIVFFSDVRGFTAMSEKLDPEALVKILNRYMTRMVRVILSHGGIVDKYVGDAIMAVWGVPIAKGNDAHQAIMACLGMRKALAELNEELEAEGLPVLRIGMGLNYGPLISGNIGSDERMEFTVIGDTVNTASRIESLTKEFGTDLLISRELLEQVPEQFVVEKAHEAKVKGKSEPLAVFKVHGYLDENRQEVRVETAYSSYAAEKSDKVVHEKKHEEQGPVADAAADPVAVSVSAPVVEPVAAEPAVAAAEPAVSAAEPVITAADPVVASTAADSMQEPALTLNAPVAVDTPMTVESPATVETPVTAEPPGTPLLLETHAATLPQIRSAAVPSPASESPKALWERYFQPRVTRFVKLPTFHKSATLAGASAGNAAERVVSAPAFLAPASTLTRAASALRYRMRKSYWTRRKALMKRIADEQSKAEKLKTTLSSTDLRLKQAEEEAVELRIVISLLEERLAEKEAALAQATEPLKRSA